MQIKWPLPPQVQAEVASRAPSEAVVAGLATDMATPQRYAAGWLVVTPAHILTFLPAEASGEWLVQEYSTSAVRWAKVDPLIGGGRLQAQIGGQLVDLIYFSSSLAERFAEVARVLEKLGKGEDPGESAAEEPRRCSKCHRLLPEPGGLCPACVRKAAVFMRIARYMKPYWPSALALALVAIASTGARLMPPRITRMLLDQVLAGRLPGAKGNRGCAPDGWNGIGYGRRRHRIHPDWVGMQGSKWDEEQRRNEDRGK